MTRQLASREDRLARTALTVAAALALAAPAAAAAQHPVGPAPPPGGGAAPSFSPPPPPSSSPPPSSASPRVHAPVPSSPRPGYAPARPPAVYGVRPVTRAPPVVAPALHPPYPAPPPGWALPRPVAPYPPPWYGYPSYGYPVWGIGIGWGWGWGWGWYGEEPWFPPGWAYEAVPPEGVPPPEGIPPPPGAVPPPPGWPPPPRHEGPHTRLDLYGGFGVDTSAFAGGLDGVFEGDTFGMQLGLQLVDPGHHYYTPLVGSGSQLFGHFTGHLTALLAKGAAGRLRAELGAGLLTWPDAGPDAGAVAFGPDLGLSGELQLAGPLAAAFHVRASPYPTPVYDAAGSLGFDAGTVALTAGWFYLSVRPGSAGANTTSFDANGPIFGIAWGW